MSIITSRRQIDDSEIKRLRENVASATERRRVRIEQADRERRRALDEANEEFVQAVGKAREDGLIWRHICTASSLTRQQLQRLVAAHDQ